MVVMVLVVIEVEGEGVLFPMKGRRGGKVEAQEGDVIAGTVPPVGTEGEGIIPMEGESAREEADETIRSGG